MKNIITHIKGIFAAILVLCIGFIVSNASEPTDCYDVTEITLPSSSIIKTKTTGNIYFLKINIKCPGTSIKDIKLFKSKENNYLGNDYNEFIEFPEENYILKNYRGTIEVKFKVPSRNLKFKINYINLLNNKEGYSFSKDNFSVKPKNESFVISKNFTEGSMKVLPRNLINLHDDNYTSGDTRCNKLVSYDSETYEKLKFAYSLGVINGKSTNINVVFFSDNKQYIVYENTCYTKVDEKDTLLKNRIIKYKSNNFDIISGSKSWGGVGTNDDSNNPSKNSVQTEVRQNVVKDLKFNKAGW